MVKKKKRAIIAGYWKMEGRGGGWGSQKKFLLSLLLSACFPQRTFLLFFLKQLGNIFKSRRWLFLPPPCKPILGSWMAEVAIIIPGAIERGGETQPGDLVCPKGVVEGCARETLKIPTSVT